jgi:hypothetical protein
MPHTYVLMHYLTGHSAGRAGLSPAIVFVPLLPILVFALCVIVDRSRPVDDSDGGGGRDGGSGPPMPKGPAPGAQPDWWPEFERQFAAHVAAASADARMRTPMPARTRDGSASAHPGDVDRVLLTIPTQGSAD